MYTTRFRSWGWRKNRPRPSSGLPLDDALKGTDALLRHLLSCSEKVQILEILDPAFHAIWRAIRCEQPSSVNCILSLLLSLRARGWDNLMQITIDYVYNTSCKLHGPKHPVSEIWTTVWKLLLQS